MKVERGGPDACYVIRERTIRGSPEHVLSEIDELVRSLLAVRQLVVQKDASGQGSATRVEGGASRTSVP